MFSKYIGETKKNHANLFASAEHKDRILFYDQVDALVGKHSQVRDRRDRDAN